MHGRTFLAITALGLVTHAAAYGQMYLMSKSSSVYYPCEPTMDCPLFLSDGEPGNASSQLSSRTTSRNFLGSVFSSRSTPSLWRTAGCVETWSVSGTRRW